MSDLKFLIATMFETMWSLVILPLFFLLLILGLSGIFIYFDIKSPLWVMFLIGLPLAIVGAAVYDAIKLMINKRNQELSRYKR